MSLETWVSVATLLGFAVTLVTTVLLANGRTRKDLGAGIGRLDGKVEGLRTELKSDIGRLDGKVDDLRTELKSDIRQLDGKVEGLRTELKSDIARLDDRVFALAAGLRPLTEEARAAGPAV